MSSACGQQRPPLLLTPPATAAAGFFERSRSAGSACVLSPLPEAVAANRVNTTVVARDAIKPEFPGHH